MYNNPAFDQSRQFGQTSAQHTLHSRNAPADDIEISNVTQSFLEQLQEEPPKIDVPGVSQSFLDQLQ